MKKTENMSRQEILAAYRTIDSVVWDSELYQIERGRIFGYMIENVMKNGTLEEKRAFFKALTAYTIPFSPWMMAYLFKEKVLRIFHSEDPDEIDHNRDYTDWSYDKNEVGYALSTYNVADKSDEQKKSPLHLGNLNNFVVRIFEKDGEFWLSIEDGGHRCYFFWKIFMGLVFEEAREEEGLANDKVKKFNKLFAGKDISDVEVEKMMNEAILPVIFEDASYNASERNITKPHNHNDDIALNYKENPLWLAMRKALYENDIQFAKGATNNTIAGLFIAGKMLNFYKGSKYNLVKYLLDNQEFIDNRDELVRFVLFYAKMQNNNAITFLKKYNKGKTNGYYHTYRAQAFIRSIHLSLLEDPKYKEVYTRYGEEYEKLVENSSDGKVHVRGDECKNFAEYFEAKYCSYRKSSVIEAHFVIARDAERYMATNMATFMAYNHDINTILEFYNEHQGSGHEGCEKNVVYPLMRCLAHNEWSTYRTIVGLPNPVSPDSCVDTDKKKTGKKNSKKKEAKANA